MHAVLFAHLIFKNAFQGDDKMLRNAQNSVPSMQILGRHCDVYVLIGTVHCFDLDFGLRHALALQTRKGYVLCFRKTGHERHIERLQRGTDMLFCCMNKDGSPKKA